MIGIPRKNPKEQKMILIFLKKIKKTILTINRTEPTQIQFVDNAMSEYAFPEAKESRDKSEGEWKPLKRVGYVCPKCGKGTMKLDEGIVLTSNPPQYRYQCDKCGYVECSSGQIEVS